MARISPQAELRLQLGLTQAIYTQFKCRQESAYFFCVLISEQHTVLVAVGLQTLAPPGHDLNLFLVKEKRSSVQGHILPSCATGLVG